MPSAPRPAEDAPHVEVAAGSTTVRVVAVLYLTQIFSSLAVPGSTTTKKGSASVEKPDMATAKVILVAAALSVVPSVLDTGAPRYDLLLLPLTAIKLLVFD